MIAVPGQPANDLCDRHLGSRAETCYVSAARAFWACPWARCSELRDACAQVPRPGSDRRPGWGRAKSVILLYLQGGPSHIDLWDPKDNVPDNVRSVFKTIATKTPGIQVTEVLPRLSQVTDKLTFIRTMSYMPTGLFNHTAAFYQMMTGYTTDKVSPSGLLEPPSQKDFPNFGANIIRLRPSDVPMLPFVMLPRPLQEGNVLDKGGTAGFLGKAYDPYTLYPDGDDMDGDKMDRIKIADLQLRPDVFTMRLQRRATLREAIDAEMPAIEEAVSEYNLNDSYVKGLSLILSGRACRRSTWRASPPSSATSTAGTPAGRAACWPVD